MPRKEQPSINDRLIVALDVETSEQGLTLVRKLQGPVTTFKVGSQLFTKAGPAVIREIHGLGGRIFLDLKFHDIPSTVAKAAIEAARLGVFMFNVHVSGGGTMMKRCVEMVSEACDKERLARPLIIGVTLLTSICEETIKEDLGMTRTVHEQVTHFAKLAKADGLDGVVASAREIRSIREACGEDFVIVTPGIRPEGTTADDQSRIATPARAVRDGADYLVVGRPITGSDDPLKSAQDILNEMEDRS